MLRSVRLPLVVPLSGFILLISACTGTPPPSAVAVATEPARSSDYIAALPEGEIRRQVILGCTPCHQIGTLAAHKRTLEEWRAVIARMKQIDDHLDLALIQLEAEPLAQWLTANARLPQQGYAIPTAPADIREYPAGPKSGFYHDMALAAGKAWLADYFGNKLYGIDVETGAVETHDMPVNVAPGKPGGAHQIDTTRDGLLWITFTKSEQVMRFDPRAKQFRVYDGFEPGGNVQYFVVDADRYVYQDKRGGIWMTHFSREILSRLDPKTGKITVYKTPRTEHMKEKGVHLYAAVADSQGRLWYTGPTATASACSTRRPARPGSRTCPRRMSGRSGWRSTRMTCCGFRNWRAARSRCTTRGRVRLWIACNSPSRATSPTASGATATRAISGSPARAPTASTASTRGQKSSRSTVCREPGRTRAR